MNPGQVAPAVGQILSEKEYKEWIVYRARMHFGYLLACLNGDMRGVEGMHFPNLDLLSNQIATLLENIEAAHIIREPKLSLVKRQPS